ncbi:MAG TPA: hypothetical protein VH165_28325 [Kofleriaceae bacterium]|jgi:hypothetical protein|nr:hypothetical protein [Kofleriaceae bacterium]
MTFHSIPQARVVRKAGQLMSPPPAPRDDGTPIGEQLRAALGYAVGLWPLTCVILLVFGLLVMAGNAGTP